jgi:hypothetical protein
MDASAWIAADATSDRAAFLKTMPTPPDESDPGFSFRAMKTGDVVVLRAGLIVTRLRGGAARKFLLRIARLPPAGQQHLMARVTGNYRRGNERLAGQHLRALND